MTTSQPGQSDSWRWGVAAACIIVWLTLGQLCLAATAQRPQIGLRASERNGELVVTWVQPAGHAWEAGIKRGATLVSINRRPVTEHTPPAAAEKASSVEARNPSGAIVTASDRSASSDSDTRRVSFLVLSACFMVVGVAIFLLGMELTTGYIILGLSVSSAVALVVGIATPFGASWALAIEHVAVISFGASIFLLFLAFPINRLNSRLGRVVAWSCVGTAIVLAATYLGVFIFHPEAFTWLMRGELAILALDFVASGMLAMSTLIHRSTQRRARPALALIALGMLAGLAPFYLLIIVPPLFEIEPLAPVDDVVMSMVLMPVGLGTAVLGWQFSGITRLARRAFVAITVWTALASVYTLGLSLLRQTVVETRWHLSLVSWTALTVVLTASTFAIAQHYLRIWLERKLFHDIYNYASVLEQLSNEIVHLHGVEPIATHILRRLTHVLDLRWAEIALGAPGEPQARYSSGDGAQGDALRRIVEDNVPEVLFVPLRTEQESLGTLAVGPKRHDMELLREDRVLVATLAPLVGTALQNALLTQSLEAQVAKLAEREHELATLTAQLMQVQEDERRRIALDLHDDPLQRAILLSREMSDVPGCPQCSQRQQWVEEISASLRAICAGLRPPMLDDLGLGPALEWLVSEVSARSDLATSLVVENGSTTTFGRVEANLEVALYRIAQEALTNCLRHAQATHVAVTLGRDDQMVWLHIADNGRGIDNANVHTGVPGSPPHLGILGMRERVRPWNGQVRVETRLTGGTLVVTNVVLRGQDERIQRERVHQSTHR